MGFFSDKCPTCGGKVRRTAAFCPHCGAAAPKAQMVCPACGAEVSWASKFCTGCGVPIHVTEGEHPSVDWLNRWSREEGEFARRIEAADLRGTLHRGLVVMAGTQALVFQGGAFTGVVPPGTYDLNRPMGQVDAAAPATAILIDAGDVMLSLGYVHVRTREDVAVDVTADIVVRLADPATLYTNLMHGRESVTEEALRDLVRAETLNLVQARIRQVSVRDLLGNADLKTALESDLRDGLARTLARSGLDLVQLRYLDFTGEAYEKVRQAHGERFVAEELAAESEARAALNRRIRETLTREQMDKFSSAKDLEEFIRQTEHELGMKGVIRGQEMEDLKRAYEEKKEDRVAARRHLFEVMELQHQQAVGRLKRAEELERVEHGITVEDRGHAAALARERAADEQDLDIAGQAAKVAQQIQQDQLKVKEQAQQLELDRKRQEQQLEVDRITALARAGTEALIAGSPAEQATVIAGLKKTEMLKGYSEGQILAMAAADSPAVAEAFKEKFRSLGSTDAQQQVAAMYQKMLEEQKAASGDLAQVQREHAKMLQELFQQALTVQGQVATSAAQAGRPQVVLTPTGPGPTVIASGPGPTVVASPPLVVCRACGRQTPAGTRFCDACGAAMA